jgi:hypothetical protein
MYILEFVFVSLNIDALDRHFEILGFAVSVISFLLIKYLLFFLNSSNEIDKNKQNHGSQF